MEPFGDVLDAEAGADGSLFDDFHRCGQCPCAQQQRKVGGRLRAGHASDLEARSKFILNGCNGQNLTTTTLKKDHGHWLADVLARDLSQYAAG